MLLALLEVMAFIGKGKGVVNVNPANGSLKHRILYCSTYPVRSLKQCRAGWMSRNFSRDALDHTMYLNAKRLLAL